jgi:protein-S-isoprenylcysteine O-methyltransferase Ste14
VSWTIAAIWTTRQTGSAPRSSYRLYLAIAMLGFFALFYIGPSRATPLWLVPDRLGWAGVALTAAGASFAWWARLHLGNLWSGGIVRREGHRIIDTGPYGIVRHPIYTGLIVAAFALAALKATPLALAGALLVAIGFALKARVEERFLAAELGAEDYGRYRGRVPMLIPFAPTWLG